MSESQPPAEDASPTPPPAEPNGEAPTGDERNLAVLAHLLGILTSVVGALIIWLLKKESSSYLNEQGKEAPNFQIKVMIAWAIAGVTTVIGIGCILLPAVWVLDIVFCIMAAIACSRGEHYRYPLSIRLVS